MGKNDLELLEIYMDMVEKQDEIIYRMTALLKSYHSIYDFILL